MNVTKGPLEGILIIQPTFFNDDRGLFFEAYHSEKLKSYGLPEKFVQDNVSVSKKGVLRGLHFQNPPHSQGKLVSVPKGSVLDVAVDIRKNSPTYGQHFSMELSDQNHTILYIAPGFAHGFLTLEDNTQFVYKCSNFYNKESEDAILWSDPDLNIKWGIENPIISTKDNQAQYFKTFVSQFRK